MTDPTRVTIHAETYRALTRRVQAFAALPIATLDAMTLKAKLTEIGQA